MIGKPLFTPEQAQYLRDNVFGRSHTELVAMMNERFGLHITGKQIHAYLKNHRLQTGRTGYFPKGNIPLNKGVKGISYPGMEATQFKKGAMPQTWKPVGTESLRSDGYIWVKIAEPHKWKEKHRLIWEAANGRIPKGHKVIFGDGNRLNTDLDNLILITDAQMARLNQNGLIGGSAELTRAGILVADIISKCAERKKSQKNKRTKKQCVKEALYRKMIKTLDIEMHKVKGIDLRNSKEFEEYCAVEQKESVESIYSRLGYHVIAAESLGAQTIQLNLNELYLGAVGDGKEPGTKETAPKRQYHKKQSTASPVTASPEDKEAQAPPAASPEPVDKNSESKPLETPEPDPAPNNEAAEKAVDEKEQAPMLQGPELKEPCEPIPSEKVPQITVRPDFTRIISEEEAGIKKRHRRTKEELEVEAKQEAKDYEKYNKPKPTAFDRPTEDIALGEIDEAKLRRRTQAALKTYAANHSDTLRPLIRATGNRVTEDTIKAILADSDAGRLIHVQAIDKALKQLALADAGKASDSRGYDMT